MASDKGEVSGDAPKVGVKPLQPKVSLDDVNKLESELRELITHLGDETVQTALDDRISKDKKILETTGLIKLTPLKEKDSKEKDFYALKDPEDKDVFGLAGLQANMKSFFEAQLAGIEIDKKDKDAAANKKAVNKKLAELHKARQQLLDQAVAKEAADMAAKAYRDLKNHLKYALAESEAVGAGENADAPGEASKFLDDLGRSPNQTMQTPTDKAPPTGGVPSYVTKDGNSLVSNDPEALGMAFAAAGWKRVKISSPNPEFAIRAARAALKHGVEKVEFSEELQKMFSDAHNFYSQKQYDVLYGQYVALQKEMNLKLNKKNYNSAFTAKEEIDKREADAQDEKSFNKDLWLQIPTTDSRAHAGFLSSLTDRDKAELAYDLSQIQLPNHWIPEKSLLGRLSKDMVAVNVVEYIHHCIDPVNSKKAFLRQLTDVTVEKTTAKMKESADNNDPKQITTDISNMLVHPTATKDIRWDIQKGLINNINGLEGLPDDQKDFVRAGIIVNYMRDALQKDPRIFIKNDPHAFPNMSRHIAQTVNNQEVFKEALEGLVSDSVRSPDEYKQYEPLLKQVYKDLSSKDVKKVNGVPFSKDEELIIGKPEKKNFGM